MSIYVIIIVVIFVLPLWCCGKLELWGREKRGLGEATSFWGNQKTAMYHLSFFISITLCLTFPLSSTASWFQQVSCFFSTNDHCKIQLINTSFLYEKNDKAGQGEWMLEGWGKELRSFPLYLDTKGIYSLTTFRILSFLGCTLLS